MRNNFTVQFNKTYRVFVAENSTWQNKIKKIVNRGQGETTLQKKMITFKYKSEQTFFKNVYRNI